MASPFVNATMCALMINVAYGQCTDVDYDAALFFVGTLTKLVLPFFNLLPHIIGILCISALLVGSWERVYRIFVDILYVIRHLVVELLLEGWCVVLHKAGGQIPEHIIGVNRLRVHVSLIFACLSLSVFARYIHFHEPVLLPHFSQTVGSALVWFHVVHGWFATWEAIWEILVFHRVTSFLGTLATFTGLLLTCVQFLWASCHFLAGLYHHLP